MPISGYSLQSTIVVTILLLRITEISLSGNTNKIKNEFTSKIFTRTSDQVIMGRFGKVKGLEFFEMINSTISHHVCTAYLGIKYATIGANLFMPPRSYLARSWTTVDAAITLTDPCPQNVPTVTEELQPPKGYKSILERISSFAKHSTSDCLSLNIYIPPRDQIQSTHSIFLSYIGKKCD